jgi:hypothetical protein
MCDAPARLHASAAAAKVAPEVITSSIRTTARPFSDAQNAGGARWRPRGSRTAQTGHAHPASPSRASGQGRAPRRRLPVTAAMESAKLRGLVVTPRQDEGVQRHRNEDRIIAQKVSPRPRHPRPRGARDVGPVAVFQAKDQLSAHIRITHHGAPGLPRARDGVAFLADQALVPGVLARQRLAAEIAGGAENEGRFGPARAAEREILVHPGAAIQAFGRKHRMQERLHSHDRPLDCRGSVNRTREPLSLTIPQPRLVDETALPATAPARGWTTPISSMRSAADEIKERLKDVNRTFTAPAIVTRLPEIWAEVPPAWRCVRPMPVLDLAARRP